ncbi:hypothetical protein HWV62_29871 [Athelia sp. TMB]|nr:hypothetical protein HWV62_29871 [Athelia sp. TMB]
MGGMEGRRLRVLSPSWGDGGHGAKFKAGLVAQVPIRLQQGVMAEPVTTREEEADLICSLGFSAATLSSLAHYHPQPTHHGRYCLLAIRKALETLTTNYAKQILNPCLSALDILEMRTYIKLSLDTFFQMLSNMRMRQYSISSSPSWNPQHVTLTISIVEGPTLPHRFPFKSDDIPYGYSCDVSLTCAKGVPLSAGSANRFFVLSGLGYCVAAVNSR